MHEYGYLKVRFLVCKCNYGFVICIYKHDKCNLTKQTNESIGFAFDI